MDGYCVHIRYWIKVYKWFRVLQTPKLLVRVFCIIVLMFHIWLLTCWRSHGDNTVYCCDVLTNSLLVMDSSTNATNEARNVYFFKTTFEKCYPWFMRLISLYLSVKRCGDSFVLFYHFYQISGHNYNAKWTKCLMHWLMGVK